MPPTIDLLADSNIPSFDLSEGRDRYADVLSISLFRWAIASRDRLANVECGELVDDRSSENPDPDIPVVPGLEVRSDEPVPVDAIDGRDESVPDIEM